MLTIWRAAHALDAALPARTVHAGRFVALADEREAHEQRLAGDRREDRLALQDLLPAERADEVHLQLRLGAVVGEHAERSGQLVEAGRHIGEIPALLDLDHLRLRIEHLEVDAVDLPLGLEIRREAEHHLGAALTAARGQQDHRRQQHSTHEHLPNAPATRRWAACR